MKTLARLLCLMLLIAAIILPATASASSLDDDKVIFGGNFTLTTGETLNGDLVVFGGNVVLEETSIVNGDAVVLGGNVTCNGTINGNLVVLGGQVDLQELARVNGDLTALGSSYERASGAYISGNIVTERTIPFEFRMPDKPGLFEGDFPSFGLQQLPLVSASWFFFRLLIWTGLAILIALFIQDQASVINRTAFGQPLMAILVGLGLILVAPLVLLALIVTILLSPVSLLGILALIAAWAVGMVAVSIEIGRKLAEALKVTWPAPALAGVGMFFLSLIFNGFNQLVPCVGWLPKFVLGTWVIGAVILTRFGTREYPALSGGERTAVDDLPLPPAFESGTDPAPKAHPVDATPAAAELAEAEGLDLAKIQGSGAGGKITLNDVRQALKS